MTKVTQNTFDPGMKQLNIKDGETQIEWVANVGIVNSVQTRTLLKHLTNYFSSKRSGAYLGTKLRKRFYGELSALKITAKTRFDKY